MASSSWRGPMASMALVKDVWFVPGRQMKSGRFVRQMASPGGQSLGGGSAPLVGG